MRILRVIGSKGPDLGIGAIEIDGGAPIEFDCYEVIHRTGVTLFVAPIPDSGVSVNVYATGSKNASSSGTSIVIDDPGQVTDDATGSLSTYSKNGLVSQVRGISAFTRPATVYLRLFNGGAELSGNGYAAVAITNDSTNFPAAEGRAKVLAGFWLFPPATSVAWTFDEVRLYDASSGGNALASHVVGATTVSVGQVYVFDGTGGSELSLLCPAGGLVDDQANAVLDHLLGGGDYTADATTYGAYYAGDPQGAGAQAGSRVAITNSGAVWNAASGGMTSNKAAISLTAQPTATHWAEFDAAMAGNLRWSAALSKMPSASTIPINGLRFEFV